MYEKILEHKEHSEMKRDFSIVYDALVEATMKYNEKFTKKQNDNLVKAMDILKEIVNEV